MDLRGYWLRQYALRRTAMRKRIRRAIFFGETHAQTQNFCHDPIITHVHFVRRKPACPRKCRANTGGNAVQWDRVGARARQQALEEPAWLKDGSGFYYTYYPYEADKDYSEHDFGIDGNIECGGNFTKLDALIEGVHVGILIFIAIHRIIQSLAIRLICLVTLGRDAYKHLCVEPRSRYIAILQVSSQSCRQRRTNSRLQTDSAQTGLTTEPHGMARPCSPEHSLLRKMYLTISLLLQI